MTITLCNMCMLVGEDGRVLVQHRLPKPTNPWCGHTFPGGHIEPHEDVTASVVREMREETGLTVSRLSLRGLVEWMHADGGRYLVFLYRADAYEGTLLSSAEGRME